MLVFIRELPESITTANLAQLVDRAVGRGWSTFLRHRGNYSDLRILKIIDRDKRSTEYHGLVEIEPPDAARTAIKRLSSFRCKGMRFEVRRYFRRSAYLDRRGQMPGREELKFMDRRTGDRRRPNLQIEHVVISGDRREAV